MTRRSRAAHDPLWMVPTSVRLAEPDYRRLISVAESRGMSVSALVRDAVLRSLDGTLSEDADRIPSGAEVVSLRKLLSYATVFHVNLSGLVDAYHSIYVCSPMMGSGWYLWPLPWIGECRSALAGPFDTVEEAVSKAESILKLREAGGKP
jgi:hypothetical protein